jgi:diguanylate cyclase (GGDEF)-like protein/PAS domain S-box-containing protein
VAGARIYFDLVVLIASGWIDSGGVERLKPEPENEPNGASYGTDESTHANGPWGEDYRWMRSVVEHSSENITIVDPDGTLRYASPAFGRMLGYTPEEVVGKMNVLDHVHPDDLPHVLEETEKALSEGGVATNEAEYRFRHADGSWRWVESVGTYLLDDPHVKGVVVQTRDVTGRKEAEKRLAESERRFSSVVSTAHAYAYRCLNEPGYPNVYASEYALELTGYQPDELLVEGEIRFSDLIVEEDRNRVTGEIQNALAERRSFETRYALRRRDGQIRHVLEHGQGVYGEDGEVEAIEGLVYDVTEAVQVEERLRETEAGYRTLVERVPPTIYIQRPREGQTAAYDTTFMSPRVEEILGYPPGRFLEDPHFWDNVIHPDDRERVLAEDERTDRTGEPFSMEYRVVDERGRTVWIRDEATLVRDDAGESIYWFGTLTDVTERKRAESALRESEQRFRGTFERAATGMALVGTDGRFLRVNRSLCEILGYPERELLGKTFQEITHPDDVGVDLEHLRRLLAGEVRTYQTEKRYLHQDGHVVWALLSASVVHNEEGEPLYFISQIQDVSERKVLEERLMSQAFHDPLTGLANRHLFVNRLAHALERTRRRRDRQAVVLFMDLDSFKVVNDSLGHEVGDHLLVLVAERLRRCLRPEDTLARFGGDEFVVLLEDVEDPGEAVRVAERITNELKRPFEVDGRSLFASFSIGIAQGNARTKSPLDLLRDADTAMYRAKSDHADYRVFAPAMYERVMKRLELENDLRRGVEDQEFVVHYQPIVDLETGETWGMEALLRWEHPERGLLEASKFMAVFEESGLTVPTGERVLEEACYQALRWQAQRPLTPPLVVAVNLSAVQLERSDLARIGAEVLGKTGLDPGRLSLDVTETAYIRILEERIATLDRLKELGVGVAIDDFGVGYSSLSYLKRLPADILKIDRSFVRGVGEVEEDTAIVRMVIDLAHTLGMKVVAEGIEEWGQATLLAEMGCDMGQGFYFSRPLLPEAVPGFLAG